MKQKFSWTTAVLLGTTLMTISSSRAQQSVAADFSSPAKPKASNQPTVHSNQQMLEVQKVGEYQSCNHGEETCGDDLALSAIAKIQTHELDGHTAATVYVRNIPVITLIGTGPVTLENLAQTGATQNSCSQKNHPIFNYVGKAREVTPSSNNWNNSLEYIVSTTQDNPADPVWKASAIASKLNQISRDGADEKTISLLPTPSKNNHYSIRVNGQELVEINSQAILPNTTHSYQQDALQITNRLRRLIANAPPILEIPGQPKPKGQEIAIGPVVIRVISGWASWYGPGFDGQLSASGEIFDANEMTAAHQDLPFGTQVKVTNLDNGRSVIVRINDRGPYEGDRIIDLSFGAAQMLGMVHTGVAPVRLEILGEQQARR